MKMTAALVERTLTQFEAQAIPDNHPVVPELIRLFGEHTFFLDGNGLNVVEPDERAAAPTRSGRVVNLASWSSEDPPSLAPHEPQPTDVIVVLGPEH